MTTIPDEKLSALSSRTIPEPLYGTLPEASIYFLLEYNGVWGSHVIDENDLSADVMNHLKSVPDAKTLFIRQPGQSGWTDDKITLYIAVSEAQPPALYHLNLNSYDDILSLDLNAIIAGDALQPVDEQLYAVCTNGRRDVCCSKYGVALVESLAKQVGTAAWRISHMGGHRFAATMLCFPHGIGYGYLDAEHAPAVIESYTNGRMLLDHYRGWSIHPQPAQAADYFLRSQHGLDAIDAVRFISLEAAGEQEWAVTLQTTADQATHTVRVRRVMSEYTVYKTSGDEQPVQVPRFELVSIQ